MNVSITVWINVNLVLPRQVDCFNEPSPVF
uniref:Uncharacterized protein n=1 Tax=Anguilla anguilla TaxID=7936 RepID=A0A0E9WJD7_ANGAN